MPPGLLLALDAGVRRPLKERGGLGIEGPLLLRAQALLDRFFRFHIGAELRTDPFLRWILPLEERLDGVQARADTAPDPRGGEPAQPARDGGVSRPEADPRRADAKAPDSAESGAGGR